MTTAATRPLAYALATALLAAVPGTAAAQTTTTLNAAAYHPVDRDQAVSVAVYDASADAEALAERLRAALAEAGWTVRDDAPLRLGLTISTDADSGGGDGSVLSVEGVNRDSRDARYSAHVRVFSSQETSLVGGAAESAPGAARARVQLDLTGPDGRRLWDGWAVTSLGRGTPSDAAAAALPALVDAIGHTVRAAGASATAPTGR